MPASAVFWLIAALIVLVTLGVLLRALLARRAGPATPGADRASIAIFRDERRELDDDLAAGAIDAATHARLVDELATRLGREVDATTATAATPASAATSAPAAISAPAATSATAATTDTTTAATTDASPAPGRAPLVTAIVLAVLLPVVIAITYLAIGRPQSVVSLPAPGARPTNEAEVVALIDSLARRMRANPVDPRGWALLGRSYAALGRYEDSARAFAQAAARAPDDPTILADYADTLSMVQGTLQGKAGELVDRALAIDPHNHKALALAATAAAERRDFDGALARWRALAALLPAGGDPAREVAQAIADVERQRDAARSSAAASPPAAGRAVSGDVSIAPELAARASPGDTVFIFARAVEGPRMPLAVMRTTVSALPMAFTLDDSMAMAPGATISSATKVVVEARVSKRGSADPASGDLVGKSSPVTPGSTNIHVRIDAVNP
jgi:cytochrome c-type biogenesis protein CcmH